MTLPVLFEGFMMLQDIGNDAPVPYLKPIPSANTFQRAYSTFIRPTDLSAMGQIAREHVDYLSDLDDVALARLETWEPSAYVRKVAVDFRGDIHVIQDRITITREDVFEYAMMEMPEALLAALPKMVEADADFRSVDVQFAIAFMLSDLEKADELYLFNAILNRIQGGDAEFGRAFIKWLSPDGGTLLLRDNLCRPFKSLFDDRGVEGRQNLVWENAWTGIDSAKLAYREEFRVGGLGKSSSADFGIERSNQRPRM